MALISDAPGTESQHAHRADSMSRNCSSPEVVLDDGYSDAYDSDAFQMSLAEIQPPHGAPVEPGDPEMDPEPSGYGADWLQWKRRQRSRVWEILSQPIGQHSIQQEDKTVSQHSTEPDLESESDDDLPSMSQVFSQISQTIM